MKAIRALRRRQGEHAILEGPHLVEEAVSARIEIQSLLLTPELASLPRWRDLGASLARPPIVVAADLLADLADADSPRGALAGARLARGGASTLPVVEDGLYLYLDGVQDPGNLGALARVAEAFDVAALALGPGCAHPNHPRALRASAGSLLRLTAARDVGAEALASHLASISPRWAALEAHGGVALPGERPEGPLVLALGAEGSGLSEATRARVSTLWTIPLSGRVESLNVAVAAGIALHALRPRRARV